MPQITTRSVLISAAASLASLSAAKRTEFLADLPKEVLAELPWLFEVWAHPHQLPPEGDWRIWMILGGRGAGKTRAGAEWVRAAAETGRAGRIGLIGQSLDQTREVMVFGESGLLATAPPARRPQWIASRQMLRWPNGAEARLFSAHDPEALRGPQFDAVWADEVAKWRQAEAAWDMLMMGLRLGEQPQACVTTTPRGGPFLKALLAQNGVVSTHAPTKANRAYLAKGFLASVEALYGGTRLGQQEIEGQLIEEAEGALWPADLLRIGTPPPLERVVVAVDPPVSGHAGSDACGIVVAGQSAEGTFWVLEDATVQGVSPLVWAGKVADAYRRHGAQRIVAEVNQGGVLVEAVLRQVDPNLPIRRVHASQGKAARAEPIAALYEQGRVFHARGLGALEAQMSLMTRNGFAGKGSPDRVDALVWALTELCGQTSAAGPQIRSL